MLEIGCGAGERLAWLQANQGYDCSGIEPSAQAVACAKASGINATQGTAEHLPYDNATFEIVIFGFCLYLCDRSDLFRIASEADRVLKSPGWLLIYDFYADKPTRRPYHHAQGLYSYKMDYRSLFSWHPSYTCYKHEILHHMDSCFTDDPQEWVALSVLRKEQHWSD
ncbi:class I SAM-dependent methyltransferase [Lamprobacter modestohalophilus]|uniref:class I SAM-dependent methyltransferase n=1 Tax=Lamprobacter modestohalophilus TaxID=1064514 RepID=UPI003D18ADAA